MVVERRRKQRGERPRRGVAFALKHLTPSSEGVIAGDVRTTADRTAPETTSNVKNTPARGALKPAATLAAAPAASSCRRLRNVADPAFCIDTDLIARVKKVGARREAAHEAGDTHTDLNGRPSGPESCPSQASPPPPRRARERVNGDDRRAALDLRDVLGEARPKLLLWHDRAKRRDGNAAHGRDGKCERGPWESRRMLGIPRRGRSGASSLCGSVDGRDRRVAIDSLKTATAHRSICR